MEKEAIAHLYLDLLAKVLTGTLCDDEPDHESPDRRAFVTAFAMHYIRGSAISMLPRKRMDNIRDCVRRVISDGVAGDYVEAGVWRGGACIFARAALDVYGGADRTVWACDSFEGMPKPDASKYPQEAKFYESPLMQDIYNRLEATLPDVKRNFAAYGMLDAKVRFLKGWFKDTLPNAEIDKVCVLHLDGDYYESTMDVLNNLYDKASPGSFIIIDDYGETSWADCRGAIDDFRRARDITAPLEPVDSKCHYWRKPF